MDQAPPTSVPLGVCKAEFENAKARLSERFRQSPPLRYGYVPYPPFVEAANHKSSNGSPRGPVVDYIMVLPRIWERKPNRIGSVGPK